MHLLEALQKLYPESSKNTLKSWIEQKRVEINGKLALHGNIEVDLDTEITLGNRNLRKIEGVEIIYKDPHLIAIYKPRGLLTVSTDFETERTAHAILKRNFKNVFVVHRLDQETSGVMIFALTEQTMKGLKELFYHHDISRKYVAIVEGEVEEDAGTWDSYLIEDKYYKVHETSNKEQGERAITHWKVLRKNKNHTRLELTLETGKKNQIRVHCKSAGHLIVGDQKYGAKKSHVKRLCLHAQKLAFIHPITQKPLTFESPAPGIFTQLVADNQ